MFSYAYIEFENKESAVRAKLLSDSLFKGRLITVIPKRKNVPGVGAGAGGFRGGRGNMMNQFAAMMQMMMNPRGRGGRGGAGFKPRGGAGPKKPATE